MTEDDTGDYDWDDYESGPFCRHWCDPFDCRECLAGCAHCGHQGLDHYFGDNGDCQDCDTCPGWKDREDA